MRRFPPKTHRGVTLLEMLICLCVITLIGVATATVLGNGRALRERAAHRAGLALLAQGELDRLRLRPLSDLRPGVSQVPRGGLPAAVRVERTVTRRADGFTELRVAAWRQSPAGTVRVELESIHPEARP